MTPNHRLLLAAAALILQSTPVYGLMSYDTSCTLPPGNATSEFYYVSAPNVRGSLQIVWTCLLTLTLCVYQVLHLNVPHKQRNGRDPGFWGDIKWLGCWRDICWALLVAFAPEIGLAWSFEDLMFARSELRKLHEAIPGTKSKWTLTHMFYVNMGGFGVMREGKIWTLARTHLEKAMHSKTLSEDPPITAEEICDKSKSDAFTKAISMAQITYFYVDFFARVGQGLPVSQLELGVAGVAFFAIVMYACLWHKPKSVATPTFLQLAKDNTQNVPALGHIFEPYETPLVIESFGAGGYTVDISGVLLFLGCLALGAIHLAAWNFDFPSVADEWIWRVASLLMMGIGTACMAAFQYEVYTNTEHELTDAGLVCAYVIARIVLFVEMIRCLFYLPPATFQTTSWAMSIPHLG